MRKVSTWVEQVKGKQQHPASCDIRNYLYGARPCILFGQRPVDIGLTENILWVELVDALRSDQLHRSRDSWRNDSVIQNIQYKLRTIVCGLLKHLDDYSTRLAALYVHVQCAILAGPSANMHFEIR